MPLSTLLIFVAMFGLMFWMQNQQKKQAKKAEEERQNLSKGDQIVTIGGMYAVVDEVDLANNKIVLDVDGIYLPFELTAIKRVVAKGTTQAASPVVEEASETAIVEE
ncbi:preprotein translocase subunit YajC [Streptococcus sp. sy018]|uniref:preprotein translocase subunit YajC n=1 Tax=Streptococcus sp. sy018 TaxID=2600147 RepID=UPI0011B70FC2|nr:preprotein translocase subunit YajC [Streptococcus sp. sy018]TWS94620.1 preprotein translocase subunit YajC [Streptococcus sp. sy018]